LTEGTLLLNPFDGEITPINSFGRLLLDYGGTINSQIAPDWTKVVHTSDYQLVVNYTIGPQSSDLMDWIVYDIGGETLEAVAHITGASITWMPDSSHFVAEISDY
jgi:hypothetical protein